MRPDNIKLKSIKGVLWSLLENLSMKLIQFIINVIMARILLPEDYGIITMIYVFILISQVFIDGGFATALIQEKTKDERDYSTIFTFNILVSLICYIILYFGAPYISNFYNTDITFYIRVLCLNLIFTAFSAIHKIRLIIIVNFKCIAKINIIAATISGAVGVYMAYQELGVWALIFQYLINNILSSILFILTLKWKPVCFFDLKSFCKLFPFGVKLLTANLIDRIYQNLYPLFIGKIFPTKDLGYYSRAEQFAILPAGTCADVFLRVTFPVMSSLNDESQLVNIYRRYIALSSYLIFPILILVIILAKPIILVLLTSKWESIVLLLQILCVGFLFDHISAINRNLLYVKGRADLALKLEFIKKFIAIAFLLISIPFGLIGLCIGKALYGILSVGLNSWYTKRLINVSFAEQLADFSPSAVVGFASAVCSYLFIYSILNYWMQIFIGSLIFIFVYLFFSYIFKLKVFEYSLEIIKQYLSQNRCR